MKKPRAGGPQGAEGCIRDPIVSRPEADLAPEGLAAMSAPRTRPPVGSYQWRRQRGLLVLSDHIALYRARRHPRGRSRTPLPGDIIVQEGRP